MTYMIETYYWWQYGDAERLGNHRNHDSRYVNDGPSLFDNLDRHFNYLKSQMLMLI